MNNGGGRIILVTSFKGGVGKTTVTASLAGALTKLGKRVLVVDGDFGMRCMDLVLGFENASVFDFGDIILGKSSFESAVGESETNPNLNFIAAPVSSVEVDTELENAIESFDFRQFFEQIRKKFDFVLIDTGANRDHLYDRLSSCADEALIVSLHQASSIRAAEQTAAVLAGLGVLNARLIVNSFKVRDVGADKLPGIIDIINRSSVKLIGVIPYDPKLPPDQEKGIIALSGKKVKKLYEKAILNIANRILGEKVPLFKGFLRTSARSKLL